MGDGLLAVFDNHHESSDDAIRAALRIISGAKSKLTGISKKTATLPYKWELGLIMAPAILGNIGSPDRLNFTVIGESVNLAARLESYTRQLGPNSICVGPSVRAQAQGKYDWNPLGPITMKGYTSQIEAFEIRVSTVSEPPSEKSELETA